MKSKELSNFFKIIDFIDKDNDFIDAKIKVKYFHHNQTAVIKIFLKEFLPISTLLELETKLAKINYKISLDFTINHENYNFEKVKEYFDYIKNYKLKLFAGIYAELPPSSFNFINNALVIRVHNTIELKLVEKEISSFLNYFSIYGFKKIQIKINSDNSLVETIGLKSEIQDELKNITNKNINSKNIIKKASFFKKSEIDLKEASNTHEIKDITTDITKIIITGKVIKINKFITKTQKWFYSFLLTDYKNAINSKIFVISNKQEVLVSEIKLNDTIKVSGSSKYDNYEKDQVIWINDIIKWEPLKNDRIDHHSQKRAEFHVHTKMSAMDGVSSAENYIKTAAKWKLPAIAFCDHLNLQAYPEIFNNAKKFPQLKVIYGVEMDLIPEIKLIKNATDQYLDNAEFLVFDLETTGLSVNYHEIIEFGYVVVKDGKTIEKSTILIKPKQSVPEHITEITNITNEKLENEPCIEDVLPKIQAIIANKVLVAHNSDFDMGFLKAAFENHGLPKITNPVIDTLQLAKILNPELKYYRLGTICRAYGVKYDSETAHRADNDAKVLAEVFTKMLAIINTKISSVRLNDINSLIEESISKKIRGSHITVYAKNQKGIKDLYQLVSESHTKYFYSTPKVTKSVIDKYRENLIIGSGCVNGCVFETAINKSNQELKEKISWFDFIEIQPPSVYKHLINRNQINNMQLEQVILKIINMAQQLEKLIVATSDAHYVEPYEKIFRNIIINNKAIGGVVHPLYEYKNDNVDYPDQHLRTTSEMVSEFSFLQDDKLINQIVVDNSLKLAAKFTKIEPIKTGLYTPEIVNVEQKLKDLCYKEAYKRYGKNLPTVIQERLEKELNAITNHGFAVVYWIAHKLVTKSLLDGYLVGSRGSVGSSLVATLSNITEVNPLQPHYSCQKCHYYELVLDGKVKCGYDLAEKLCPNCNLELQGDGHDIPFETFLGIDGDKIPDIDLNFSGEYQLRAHDFTKEMFGENNVFRAGTISTVANKTAYGFAKNYVEQQKLQVNNATLEWLSQGCVGVKRTTGQHPGGIIVVPKKYEITDFTPINYPADDTTSTWKTTHFDFEAIHDNLLKLDILGHVDPTALRMLYDLTGVDPKSIPSKDTKVLSLFSNLSALNIASEELNGESTGAIGIPEFGTGFVRKMLQSTKPQSFAQLVQISGLSHGTDVWLNNAELLINNETLTLKDVIGCRDDIMTYLVYQGLSSKTAFFIMEDVRKGKGLKPEYENLMRQHHVPQWYIKSCQKIKYLFPKAHATAYVLMAWRVAWYKIYYPHEYYCTYFSTRCDIFEIKTMLKGKKAILERIQEINKKLKNSVNSVSQKEKDLIPSLEVALEMYARGIAFTNIHLANSETRHFKVAIINRRKVIIPPFISLDGLGEVNAQSIVEARNMKPIISIEDLKERTNITKTNLLLFEEMGILNELKNEI